MKATGAVLLAAAACLTGCVATPAAPVTSPPSTSIGATSDVDTPAGTVRAELTESCAANRRERGVRVDGSFTGGPSRFTGTATLAGSSAADVTITMPRADPIRTRLVGGDVFVALPAGNPLRTHGIEWISAQVDDPVQGPRIIAHRLAAVAGSDAVSDTCTLLLASPTLRRLGSDDVDGTQARHFAGSLTLSTRGVPDPVPSPLAELVSGFVREQQWRLLELDLWVDDSGLAVQQRIARSFTDRMTETDQVRYRTLPRVVPVAAPPATAVVPVSEVTTR